MTTTDSVRRTNILRSPKQNGSAEIDSAQYLQQLGISIEHNRQPIQFSPNNTEYIHRWASYVQGFSASFVQSIIDRYSRVYDDPYILDPFAGCGTVLVQAKLNGLRSFGVELNPLLQFVANTKLNSWSISSRRLLETYDSLDFQRLAVPPPFLKSEKQFSKEPLDNLRKIKGAIDAFIPRTDEGKIIKDLMNLAFSAILVDSSNLKRSPCLGYDKRKVIQADAPFSFFQRKIQQIASDLDTVQKDFQQYVPRSAHVDLGNSMVFTFPEKYDLVITSPPYMNGLDYVMNYKIEMGWLGFISKHTDAKKIKDNMVVCDNVSKGLIKRFSDSNRYSDEWIESIKQGITENIKVRGNYRRSDMPELVHKYFDDMHRIMNNVANAMKNNGRFILVVGDSLIADVYVPTDLMIARIGQSLGLKLLEIEGPVK
jgi:hypothetical protein